MKDAEPNQKFRLFPLPVSQPVIWVLDMNFGPLWIRFIIMKNPVASEILTPDARFSRIKLKSVVQNQGWISLKMNYHKWLEHTRNFCFICDDISYRAAQKFSWWKLPPITKIILFPLKVKLTSKILIILSCENFLRRSLIYIFLHNFWKWNILVTGGNFWYSIQ